MTHLKPVLSADEVRRGIEAAWAQASTGIFALAVVDETGDLLGFRRSDHCAPHTAALARAKAYTAARTRSDTGEFVRMLIDRGAAVSAFGDPGLVAVQGGVVIRDPEGRLLGGIGVSGFVPTEDERLAGLARDAMIATV